MHPARLITLALLTALAGCAPVDEGDLLTPGTRAGRPSLDEVAARLPDAIAGFKRDTVTEYETRQPGYGIAVAYGRDDLDAIGTVFLYDRGLGAVPSDPQGPHLAAEFDRLMQEILAAPNGRTVRNLHERTRFDLAVPQGRALRCVELEGEMSRESIRRTICLGGAAGHFLQAQVTIADTNPTPADPRAFATAVARAARVRR
ncbi:hypothetical protein [Plastoroseomonas arctica]|uniref:Lipoprotein n=1 Tax=Plastoroseomonas arctica TaxID=1509237 RepID=A0AAF1K075_9PROT|nr:hypothetical protein [Plastoroseomonas arctica]MBR0654711.1 hypothetical protein [Plastoroseomonas arctica]